MGYTAIDINLINQLTLKSCNIYNRVLLIYDIPTIKQIGGVSSKSLQHYTIHEQLAYIRMLGEQHDSSMGKSPTAKNNTSLVNFKKWIKEGILLQLY